MDQEENDGIFGFSEDLVQSPVHKAAGVSFVDFDGLLSAPLKLQEDLKQGCGGQLWPAGMVLSRYMLRKHKDDIANSSMFVCSDFDALLLYDSLTNPSVLSWEQVVA